MGDEEEDGASIESDTASSAPCRRASAGKGEKRYEALERGKSATKRWKHSSQNGYEAAQALDGGRNSASAGAGRNSASAGWGEEQRKALEEGGAAQALAGGKALKERIMWQEQRDALDRGRTNEKKHEQRKRWRGRSSAKR